MEKIIVEIKSTREGLSNEYMTQPLNYLKGSGCKLGLIVTLGSILLNIKD